MQRAALRAVSEPRRQQILWLVWDQERPAGDIAVSFDVTFGAVSQHLRVLADAGLVAVRRNGRRRLYRARPEPVGTNVAGADLDGRFRWMIGFWDPVPAQPEPPQRP